jgi:hypothetical protein
MRPLVAALVLTLLASSGRGATIFDGDPVDPASGRPYAVLPGVPLILPQPDGKFDPPIVVQSIVGDVDLVVRATSTGVGPVMPPPVGVPPVATAGGLHVAAGSEIPFTVIASSGGADAGAPLGGPSLDGIPVVVAVFADLDGDGIVGPTAADGTGDDARELQEALFLVGRQVAVFDGGVAEGSVAVWKGAPASAGGLTVVLTAMAYVGPFRPGYFAGNVPEGPPVATLLPMFPRLDPKRVVDGEGRGGPADPHERLGFELEPAFDVPVNDAELGTPFALPTDGSSLTIDRAVVIGGTVSRARFLRPAGVTGYSPEVEAAITPGADGTLLEPQPAITIADDGAGGGLTVQLVPVDRLDNVTDPPPGTTATLIAGPGLTIAAPDGDGDPSRETVAVGSAAGVAVTIDDAGGANDSGGASSVTIVSGGVPVDVLRVQLAPGTPDGPIPPIIKGAAVDGRPAIVRSCPTRRRLAAVVDPGSGGTPTVSATLALNGAPVTTLTLSPTTPSADLPLPAGPTFAERFSLAKPALGVLELTVNAVSSAGSAVPFSLSLPVVNAMAPTALAPVLETTSVPVGVRSTLAATARVFDDCPIRRVRLMADLGRGFRGAGALRDNGRKGDAVAGDGIFTGRLRVKPSQPGSVPVRVVARNKAKLVGASPTTVVVAE